MFQQQQLRTMPGSLACFEERGFQCQATHISTEVKNEGRVLL